MKVFQSCLTLCNPHGLYSLWNSSGQNTGVGSFSLLQGIFPTQGSNPGLPHWRWILYQLGYKGIVCKEWMREKGVREGAYEKKKCVSFMTIRMSEGSTIGEIGIQRDKSPNLGSPPKVIITRACMCTLTPYPEPLHHLSEPGPFQIPDLVQDLFQV